MLAYDNNVKTLSHVLGVQLLGSALLHLHAQISVFLDQHQLAECARLSASWPIHG